MVEAASIEDSIRRGIDVADRRRIQNTPEFTGYFGMTFAPQFSDSFGDLSGVVHVAAFESNTPFNELGEGEFSELLDENLKSTFLVLKSAARLLDDAWVVIVSPPRAADEPHMVGVRGAITRMATGFESRYEGLSVNVAVPSRSASDPKLFPTLAKYSPLPNIKPGTCYPATLTTTADHDDRVVPAHSFKYAATLQAADTGAAPKLIRIETNAGHGAGKPTSKIIEERSDVLAFIAHTMKLDVK